MKPWEEMTERDIQEIKQKKCRSCRFAKRLAGDSSNLYNLFCDYSGIMKRSRGCRPDQCDKFERKRRGRK